MLKNSYNFTYCRYYFKNIYKLQSDRTQDADMSEANFCYMNILFYSTT